jgi:hypothetical protein
VYNWIDQQSNNNFIEKKLRLLDAHILTACTWPNRLSHVQKSHFE